MEFAKKLYNECLKRNIICISVHSRKYPKKLLEIYDPPYILYIRGNIEILTKKYIGIIGARNCTWYGSKIAKEVTEKVIEKGYGIVSGLALGIDTVAHITALDNNGKNIGVLGMGNDENVFYPKINLEIYTNMVKGNKNDNTVVISEYPYYMKPKKYTFPARNRIIAGICDSLFIIEAKLKSGTLITAEFAYELRKRYICAAS